MIPESEKRLLKLIGITFNQIESGVYAVILEEVDGTRKIPIIIGFPEAQSIECKLQEIVTPRPLTHDLMANMMKTFGVTLQEVQIHKLPSGVFAAELILSGPDGIKIIDSRSSDAIALAIRVGTPIYTSADILNEVGIDSDNSSSSSLRPLTRKSAVPKVKRNTTDSVKKNNEFENYDICQLKRLMKEAADNEDYERAGKLKSEIEMRGGDPNDMSDAMPF